MDDETSFHPFWESLEELEGAKRGSSSKPIVIHDDADILLIAVTKQDNIGNRCGSPPEAKPPRRTYFKVVRQVLKDLPARAPDVEGRQKTCILLPQSNENPASIEIEGISPAAVEILMRIFHKSEESAPELPDVKEIWEAIAFLDRYAISSSTCAAWFKGYVTRWMARHASELVYENSGGFRAATKLLFPCWFFGDKEFLMKISHDLVYNAIHPIKEVNPTDHRYLKLPRRTMNRLNHVKGRLKIVLMQDMWAIREGLSKGRDCPCYESTYFDHENYLINVCKVWPFELKFTKMSMQTCLESLDNYQYQAHPSNCSRCKEFPFQSKVNNAIKRTRRYFDGLCLRCMERSLKRGAIDWEWEEENREERRYLCGIEHSKPTNFFSNIFEDDQD